jgi:hypothetical protein
MFRIISFLVLFYIGYKIFLTIKKFLDISSHINKMDEEINKKKSKYSSNDIEEADYEEIK